MRRVAIKTKGLTKVFRSKSSVFRFLTRKQNLREGGEVKAVDQVNLEIPEGELFGLLGPNGAGKTTLIKLLCTLLTPDSGTAFVNGFDVKKQQSDVRKSIGTLFSVGERGFYWRLSVLRNLEFYAAIYNVPKELRKQRIDGVLNLVGLSHVSSRSFQILSGGMKRKLALARALLPDPPILLLDEPTLRLDAISAVAIKDFIRHDLCAKQKKTVLYTTHFIEEANQICHRVGIIHEGRIVACGTPKTIRNIVRTTNTFELEVQSPPKEVFQGFEKMTCVSNFTASTANGDLERLKFRFQLNDVNDLHEVLDYLRRNEVKLHRVGQEEPTLEDAFIQLTEVKGGQ